MDILIGEYSMETVLAELARCLTLLSNLHTVQIDVMSSSRGRTIFERTFKKYSYPQIRNAFVMPSSQSFLASCPQARCVGLTRNSFMSASYLQTIMENCPHLEVLEMSEKRLRFDITRRGTILSPFLSLSMFQSLNRFYIPQPSSIAFQTSAQFES